MTPRRDQKLTRKKLTMANWRQAFVSGDQTSVDFYRVCPQVLTVDPKHTVLAFHASHDGPTLFREVRRVSWRDRIQPELQELMDAPAGGKTESEEALASRLLNALAYVVYNTWDPDKYHVIMHSSGYDSRLLSLIIKKLLGRFGEAWLGKMHFVGQEWETPGFLKAMHHEEWPESSYTAYQVDKDPHEYWEAAISLDAWRGMNSPRGIPFCPLYTGIADLMRQKHFGDVRSSDMQMYSMLCAPSDHGASSVDEHGNKANDVVGFFDWWFTTQAAHTWPPIRDLILPYTSLAFNHAVLSSEVRWGRSLPRKVLTATDPVLGSFPNMFNPLKDFNRCRREPHRFLSKRLMERAIDIYENTWYGQHVAPVATLTPTTEMYYHKWWSRWTSAIICERLILRGRELRVG